MADSGANGAHPPDGTKEPRRRGRPRIHDQCQTISAVRRELASVYLGLKSGTLEPNVGRTMVYTLATLADVIKGAEVEAAVNRLEARQRGTDQQETLTQ